MPYIEEDISSAELLARYQTGQRVFRNLDVTDHDGAALVGADLRGIDIEDCFIACDLTGADLRDARVNANVKTCNFSNADLRNADFRSSALCATCFGGSRMDGAQFEGAYFHSFELGAGERPEW